MFDYHLYCGINLMNIKFMITIIIVIVQYNIIKYLYIKAYININYALGSYT